MRRQQTKREIRCSTTGTKPHHSGPPGGLEVRVVVASAPGNMWAGWIVFLVLLTPLGCTSSKEARPRESDAGGLAVLEGEEQPVFYIGEKIEVAVMIVNTSTRDVLVSARSMHPLIDWELKSEDGRLLACGSMPGRLELDGAWQYIRLRGSQRTGEQFECSDSSVFVIETEFGPYQEPGILTVRMKKPRIQYFYWGSTQPNYFDLDHEVQARLLERPRPETRNPGDGR